MRILVAEDHPRVNENICLFLKGKNLVPIPVFDGKAALKKILDESFDVLVLDRMMPQLDGISVCEAIRNQNIHTPVLFLTALGQLENKIEGFNAGADDYLVKPFALEELYSRIQALGRRKEKIVDHLFHWNACTLDANQRKLFRGEEEISLATKEFDFMLYLLQNRGRVVSKEELLEKVWGGGDALLFSDTVEVHVAYLRKKIGKECITTIRGAGYTVDAP